jgi:hypothetical protein
MDKQYTKLSALVDDEFTIQEAGGWTFKRWNNEARRMEVSDTYQEGFRKMYTIKTDKGVMDLGAGQLGNLLEIAYYKGTADLNGKTFAVKSNGKTGMDIRYYFNLKREAKPYGEGFKKFQESKSQLRKDEVPEDIDEGEPFDLSSIPFNLD